MSDDIVIQRTGAPPLRFRGELLAAGSSEREKGQGDLYHRFHEVRLYRAESGKYAAEVQYCTRWKQEAGQGRRDVLAADELAALAALLYAHDPVKGIAGGYPPIEKFAERQRRLLEALRAGYTECVGAVLSQAGYAESL